LFVDSNITLTGGDRLISPLDLGSSVASASNSVRKPEQISFLVQYLNADGMNTKISDFFESTGGSQSDVIAVSETWLSDNVSSLEIADNSIYDIYRKDRNFTDLGLVRGGGVLLLIHKSYRVFQLNLDHIIAHLPIIDIIGCKVVLNSQSFVFVFVIYIPPQTSVDDFATLMEFLEVLDYLYEHDVLFIGDFNVPNYINNNGCRIDSKNELLLNFCSILNLKQFNYITNCDNRCLDLILSSFDCSVMLDSAPLLIGSALHPPLFCICSLKSPCRKFFKSSKSCRGEERFNFRKANLLGLYDCIANCDWSFLHAVNDVNVAVGLFYEKLYDMFRQFVPLNRANSSHYPVWYTTDIIRKLKHKFKVFKRYKKTKSRSTLIEFRTLRRDLKISINAAYHEYISTVEQQLTHDPRCFWSFVNHKRKSSTIPSVMQLDEVEYSTPHTIANAFLSYFEKNFSSPSMTDFQFNNPCNNNYIHLPSISTDDILRHLLKLKPSSASGDDALPGFILKDCAQILVTPLHFLYNLILTTSVYPCLWKVGKICPIFKLGKKNIISNYRPVTILPHISKVFESIIYSYIYTNVQNVISEHQHGFFRGRSTSTNLSCISHFISAALDKNTQVDVIYTDFSKAFDRIDHNILLNKLRHFGFSDSLLNLFESYLSDRFCYVNVLGLYSARLVVNSGVPQGSNLGPLLFLLFINDIVEIFSLNVLLFADDVKLYSTIRDISDCMRLQSNIDVLYGWCRSNGLPLNRDKCYILSFSRKTKPLMFDYRIGNALLTRCFTFKDLGVTFDAQFTFNEHVDIIVASSVKTLGFIFRSCKRFRSESCLRALYFTLVRSKLEYCSIAWSPIYRRGVDALESVQRKFAKYLLFKLIAEFPPRGTPNSVLYDMANLRSLNMRRNDSFLIFLYKIIHGIINSPFLLSQIYFNVPRANLRSGRFFYVPRAVTNILHRSPLYTACTLFNSNCSECDIFVISLGQFKRLITCISEV
jgi:hypothetical protein